MLLTARLRCDIASKRVVLFNLNYSLIGRAKSSHALAIASMILIFWLSFSIEIYNYIFLDTAFFVALELLLLQVGRAGNPIRNRKPSLQRGAAVSFRQPRRGRYSDIHPRSPIHGKRRFECCRH